MKHDIDPTTTTPPPRALFSQKLAPWYAAQARRKAVRIAMLPVIAATEFFKTWAEVFRKL